MSEERHLGAGNRFADHSYSSNPNSSYQMNGLEERVFNLAQELMEKHYVFNTKDLHSLCSRVIKDEEKSSINNAISTLLRKKILIEGKTLSRPEIMENPNRRTIYSIIKSLPGINIGLIQRKVELHPSTILWHTQMLEKFQFIRTERILNKMVCFHYLHERDHDLMYVTLHKKRMMEMISIVAQHGRISMGELQGQMNINRSSFIRKIGELIEVNILLRDQENYLKINTEILPLIERFLEAP